MKGISEIFSSLIILLIIVSLIAPLLITFSNFNVVSRNSANELYQQSLTLAKLRVGLIVVGHDTKSVYLYNYGDTPVYVQTLIIKDKVIPVSRAVGAYVLVSLYNLTNVDMNVTANTPIYAILNGTYIRL
ncbi:MAG: pilin subunit UpsB [Thermoprotei archaeon]